MILKYVKSPEATIPISAVLSYPAMVSIFGSANSEKAYAIHISREELVNLQEYYPKDKIERVLRRSLPEIRRLWCTQPANLILTD